MRTTPQSDAFTLAVKHILTQHISSILSDALLRYAREKVGILSGPITPAHKQDFLKHVCARLPVFLHNKETLGGAQQELQALLEAVTPPAGPKRQDQRLKIESEDDIVRARATVREVCQQAGFMHTDQIKIATVVSELSRNIINYVGRGEMSFSVLLQGKQGVQVEARDEGPGISNIDAILAGRYQSKSGMGLGLLGCQRLMDEFEIDTAPGKGTRIKTRKYL
jgi:serine/threonine-protein kinase RsbT